MKISSFPHVHQLAFMPRLFPVNCYLVEESDQLTLIDAAMPYSSKAILKAAEQLRKPITHIMLTHAHADHVGALDALKAALPEAKVCISRRDSKLLAGDAALQPGEAQTPIKGGIPKGITTTPDVLLEEGDVIGSLRAFACPGHTPGSMAFLDKRSGALIAGDAFQTRGGAAVSGTVRPLFPFPALATWDMGTAIYSARKLAELEPSLLAVGHGKMLPNPRQTMNETIREAEKVLEKRRGH